MADVLLKVEYNSEITFPWQAEVYENGSGIPATFTLGSTREEAIQVARKRWDSVLANRVPNAPTEPEWIKLDG